MSVFCNYTQRKFSERNTWRTLAEEVRYKTAVQKDTNSAERMEGCHDQAMARKDFRKAVTLLKAPALG
jgi:hypothetical protein